MAIVLRWIIEVRDAKSDRVGGAVMPTETVNRPNWWLSMIPRRHRHLN
ncbi:hypothetical protein KCP74_14960 [Salmonella enterica subsp. enterica]|nr:hypothetical protein KCP74_14960 [Salmonella enterica subsp. enterica]